VEYRGWETVHAFEEQQGIIEPDYEDLKQEIGLPTATGVMRHGY
jgi:hypothetical protein